MHTPAAIATALDSTQLSIAYAGGNTAEVRNHGILLFLRVMSALDTAVAPRALRKLRECAVAPGLKVESFVEFQY